MSSQLEKQIEDSPFFTIAFIFATERFVTTHQRWVGILECYNRESPTLDALFTTAPGTKRKRVPPWLVDILLISFGIILLTQQANGGSKSLIISDSPSVIKVILGVLAFRILLFPVNVCLYALTDALPVYRNYLWWLRVFPGYLFFGLFLLDVVIPQALFAVFVWDVQVGRLVLLVGFIQFVFRMLQGHRVYLFAQGCRGGLDFGIALVVAIVSVWMCFFR